MGPLAESWAYGLLACRRYTVAEQLCCQIKELWVEVSRLCSIRNDKKEINSIFSESLQLQESEPPATGEGQEEPVPVKSEIAVMMEAGS